MTRPLRPCRYPLRRSHRFPCRDCSFDTLKGAEYYMVSDEVWSKAGMGARSGMLCIGCLETRLGRPLNALDFPMTIHLNRYPGRRSARLIAAMDLAPVPEPG